MSTISSFIYYFEKKEIDKGAARMSNTILFRTFYFTF